MTEYYVDSSVVLRALLGHSPATHNWFETLKNDGEASLVASRIGELEVTRVAYNAGVADSEVDDYTERFAYLPVDDGLVDEALALKVVVKSADALHLAAALRLRPDPVIFITHDFQLANAAKALGFQVHDPVTDDPGRPPVA